MMQYITIKIRVMETCRRIILYFINICFIFCAALSLNMNIYSILISQVGSGCHVRVHVTLETTGTYKIKLFLIRE